MDFETLFIQPFGFAITLFASVASAAGAFLLNLLAQSAQKGAIVRPWAWVGTGATFVASIGGAVNYTALQLDAENARTAEATRSIGEVMNGNWDFAIGNCERPVQFIAIGPSTVREVTRGFPEDKYAIRFGEYTVVVTENTPDRMQYKYTRIDDDTLQIVRRGTSVEGLDPSLTELQRC